MTTRARFVSFTGLSNLTASDIAREYTAQCARMNQILTGLLIVSYGLDFSGVLLFDKRTRFMPNAYNPPFNTNSTLDINQSLERICRQFVFCEDKENCTISYDGELIQAVAPLLQRFSQEKQDTFFVTIPHFSAADADRMDVTFDEYIKGLRNTLKGLLACEENHADGNKHVHIVFQLEKSVYALDELGVFFKDFTKGKLFDIQAVKDLPKVVAYITKASTQPIFATGVFACVNSLAKPLKNNSEILAHLIDLVIKDGVDPWKFLISSNQREKLVAFKNKKSLDTLYVESKRLRALQTIDLPMPQKPSNPEHVKLWNWLRALKSRTIYDPTFAPRHLYLCGRPNTRKSSFASYLQAGFKTFMTNVADPWWDGYNDSYDLAIIDEFTIVDPNKGGKCLVTLNRFMESARGQPLPIKYSGAQKFNVCMPVLVISNLSRESLRQAAYKYFDEAQVAAFERRFTFVDLGTDSIPKDFTYINLTRRTTDMATQFDSLDPQQFVVIMQACGVALRYVLMQPPLSVIQWMLTKYGLHMEEGEYLAIPMFRNSDSQMLAELTSMITIYANLPWVHYDYTSKTFHSTGYGPLCKFDFQFNDTELCYSTKEEESMASQFNCLPQIQVGINVLICGIFIPSLQKLGQPLIPVLLKNKPIPYFTNLQNISVVYAMFNDYAVNSRPSLFTQIGRMLGTEFLFVRNLQNDATCSICLTPLNATWLVSRCMHPLHWSCLSTYLTSGTNLCPICRQPFADMGCVNTICTCQSCCEGFRLSGIPNACLS